MPIPNYIGNVISRFLFNIFQKIKISDTQCGVIPTIYLKKSLKIKENGFQFETIFLKKFIKKNEYLECKQKPEKGDYFISIYKDTMLLKTLSLNYKIFFFKEINSIKIFKFL